MHSCRLQNRCVRGLHGFVSAFIFATETQQTIGSHPCLLTSAEAYLLCKTHDCSRKFADLTPSSCHEGVSQHGCVAVSGYGVRYPTDCWLSAWILALQSIWAAMLNAITLGIIFARISQPKQRARTIFISDSACIARRDGILKFMFRVADIRKTQVSSTCQSTLPNDTPVEPLQKHDIFPFLHSWDH